MFRTAIRLTPSFTFSLFRDRHENDYNTLNKPQPNLPQNGVERVKQMFSKNEYEEITPELHSVIQTTSSGFFIGACFGGFIKSRDAYLYFMESNQATAFKSTFDAKKKLQDYVTIAFARGAVHWGWRLGLFTGCFSLITTTIAVYRGMPALIDYVMAGAITGAVYKANLGIAAMLVGAGLGATLSGIGGLLILTLLKVTGVSMDDIRLAFYKLRVARKEQLDQATEKAATIKHDELTRHHDLLVEEKGPKRIEEIK